MKKTNPDKIADEAFAPFVAYCKDPANRGTQTKVLEMVNARLEQPIKRKDLDRYLDADPKKRAHPRYGMGKLLLDIWGEIVPTLGDAEHRAKRLTGNKSAKRMP